MLRCWYFYEIIIGNPPTSDEKSEAKRLIEELLSTNDVIGIEYYAENGSNGVSSE
jgi:hypothetical protein